MRSRLSRAVSCALVVLLTSLAQQGLAQSIRWAAPTDQALGEHPRHGSLSARDGPSTLGAASALLASEQYRVRVVYAIPSNRTPQPDSQERLQRFVLEMQEWFAEYMQRSGYERKTFAYEPDPATGLPLINVIRLEQPDTYFHAGYLGAWERTLGAVTSSFPLWQQGDAVLVVAEFHIQEPTGSFRDGTLFVGGASLDNSGVAMVSGDLLARLSFDLLADDRPYAGVVIPGIGPYPLAADAYEWFNGLTVSTLASAAYGTVMHELGHAFGPWHDFRNEAYLLNGNLMGNGFRGVRGSFLPEMFPSDEARLDPHSALILNYSRFLNPDTSFTDDSRPDGRVVSQGVVTPRDGLCALEYWAFDPPETGSPRAGMLGGVVLLRSGHVVAELPLETSSARGTIATYDYEPGVAEPWTLLVIDRQGHRYESPPVTVTCEAGHDRAPLPFISVSDSSIRTNVQVTLDAGVSSDPDGSYERLAAQWDLDGDGQFDTPLSTLKYHDTTFAEPGVYRVQARLVDDEGHASLSLPIGVRVEEGVENVRIDIKPGDPRNTVNPSAKGGVWVAVFSGAGLDARQIDVSSIRFGPKHAAASLHAVHDVNADGSPDLVLRFNVAATGIRCADRDAELHGETFSGVPVAGTDSLETVGCKKRGGKGGYISRRHPASMLWPAGRSTDAE